MSEGYMVRKLTRFISSLSLVILLLAAGCSNQAAADLTKVFPAANTVPGWQVSQEYASYTHDTLFNLVDGGADSFFAYGFQKVGVQRYTDAIGTQLNIEVWQLATTDDAYGLFSSGRVGSMVAIGNEGDTDPGRRLAFWQDRYFVNLDASQPVADATLMTMAKSISAALPHGGQTPSLIGRLPPSGAAGNVIFFHEEMSIQLQVWLGGENLLGLSQATNGVVAPYKVGGVTVQLLLIQYPDSGAASKGLKVLQSGKVADIVAAASKGTIIAAVVGKANAASAQALLQEAIK